MQEALAILHTTWKYAYYQPEQIPDGLPTLILEDYPKYG